MLVLVLVGNRRPGGEEGRGRIGGRGGMSVRHIDLVGYEAHPGFRSRLLDGTGRGNPTK